MTDPPAATQTHTSTGGDRPSPWLRAGRRTPLPRHFYWRVVLLRFLINAVALAVTVGVVPQISFAGNHRILTWLAVSAVFGLLNAFVKPIVQVVMLPLMFVSYGLVILIINAVMLWVLDLVIPMRFQTDHLFWVLVGGAVFSLIASFLESLLGLTPPIFEGPPEDLAKEIERRKHGLVDTQIRAAARFSRPASASTPASPDTVELPTVAAEPPAETHAAAAEQHAVPEARAANAGPEAEVQTEAEAPPEAGAEADASPEAEAPPEAGAEADTPAEAGAPPEAEAGAEADTPAEAEAPAESAAEEAKDQ
jgi:putative membrane protein